LVRRARAGADAARARATVARRTAGADGVRHLDGRPARGSRAPARAGGGDRPVARTRRGDPGRVPRAEDRSRGPGPRAEPVSAENAERKVVLAALAGNLGIAATKFGAAWWSGSAARLSEGVHSLVVTTNELPLLYGMRGAGDP